MTDILGKEIVGYDEACYLKQMGFNGECTGYYHCDDYGDELEDDITEEDRYECVGWRGLFRNSFSIYRAAAPSVRAAKIWCTKNKIKPYEQEKDKKIKGEITMTRTDELYSKIDALLEEFNDMSYEDLADVFDYYASDLKRRANY